LKKGIDISEWQGNLNIDDFRKIKDAGIEFIMLRCGYTSYGKSKTKYIDRYFEQNYMNCKLVGIPVGVYYYSCATTIEEGIEEANFILDIIKDKQFEYPISIDTEDNHNINDINNTDVSQASIGKTLLTLIISTICKTIEDSGYYASIYASTSWFRNNLILSDLIEYDKWIAQWSDTVNFTEKYGMWQYSSMGNVDGIEGNVDLNYAYLDYPLLMKTNGLNGFEKETIIPIQPAESIPNDPIPEEPENTNIFIKIFNAIKKILKNIITSIRSWFD